MIDDDKKEDKPVKKEPKDISKMSTDDLIKEFAEMKAGLEVDLNQVAAKKAGFPELQSDSVDDTKTAYAAQLERVQGRVRAEKEEKGEEGKKEYRAGLETEYRAAEKIVNSKKEFDKVVDERKKEFEGDNFDSMSLDELARRMSRIADDNQVLIVKQAFKELKLDWNPEIEDTIREQNREQAETLYKNIETTQKKIQEKPTEDERKAIEKKARDFLETPYRAELKIRTNSEEFQKAVDTLKEKLVKPDDKQFDVATNAAGPIKMASAMIANIDSIAPSDVLWREPVSDTLSLASLPRSNVRGAA